MDINDFRGVMTAVIFLAFVGICIWAFSRRNRKRFEESAQIPLKDDKELEEKN